MAAGWVHMHPHDFRHLFAVHAMERGVSIPQIANWLGHQDNGILAATVYGGAYSNESGHLFQFKADTHSN
jgi:integrase